MRKDAADPLVQGPSAVALDQAGLPPEGRARLDRALELDRLDVGIPGRPLGASSKVSVLGGCSVRDPPPETGNSTPLRRACMGRPLSIPRWEDVAVDAEQVVRVVGGLHGLQALEVVAVGGGGPGRSEE